MLVLRLRFSRYIPTGIIGSVASFSLLFCTLFLNQAAAASDGATRQPRHNNDLLRFNISVLDDDNARWENEELISLVKLLQGLPAELLPVNVIRAEQLPLKLFKANSGGDAHSIFPANSTELPILARQEEPYQAPARQLLHFLLQKYDIKTTVSNDPQWLAISGWNNRIIFPAANNQDERAYATPSEKQNPREDFVTAAEQFFLPPVSTAEDSIKCRIPLKYEFIKAHFSGYRSSGQGVCALPSNG